MLRRAWLLWALIPVGAAAAVYLPITHNYFWADDFYSLYRIQNTPLHEFFFLPQGDHLLASAYAVFYASYRAFGTDPQPYFVTVLALHLINVALLFVVLRRATESDALACAGALLWGTSPRHEGTLGWYSVFGHVIAATAILVVLLGLTARERSGIVRWRECAVWAACVLVAATSFGIGIGIALVLPAVAFLILPRRHGRARAIGTLAAAAAIVPVLYVVCNHAFRSRYTPFSLTTRVARAFNPNGLDMLSDLAAYGVSTGALGALWQNPDLGGLVAGRTVAIFAALAAAALALGPRRVRHYLIAALVLLAGCYLPVAAGRGGFYALRPGIALSDRYQYVAGIAVALATCVAISAVARRLRQLIVARRGGPEPSWLTPVGVGLALGWAATLLATQLGAGRPINHHDGARRETAAVLAEVRRAVAAAPAGGDVYIENRRFRAMGPVFVNAPLFPGWAGVFVVFFSDNVVDGRRVHFVDTEPRVFRFARLGRRSATLLVPSAPTQATGTAS